MTQDKISEAGYKEWECGCSTERTCDRHAGQNWNGIDPDDPAPMADEDV